MVSAVPFRVRVGVVTAPSMEKKPTAIRRSLSVWADRGAAKGVEWALPHPWTLGCVGSGMDNLLIVLETINATMSGYLAYVRVVLP